MAKVTISIEASTTKDPYARYHGKAVDQTLDTDFWITQREKIIGISPVNAKRFTHQQTLDLPPGNHTVEYGNSSMPGYEWTAKITVNGKTVAEGEVTRFKHIKGTFTIGAPPAPTIPSWLPLAVIGGVIGIGGLMYLTSKG